MGQKKGLILFDVTADSGRSHGHSGKFFLGIRPRLPLLLALVPILILGGCSHHTHTQIPTDGGAYDKRFLTWLVDHHNDDDRMVDPCAKNETIRKELRDFCTSVDQQHRERIERMTAWLKDWYAADFPRTDNIPLWLGSLNGQDFECEFLKEYEHHHADAVDPIGECARKATHPELRELCQRIAPKQEEEVKQLRQWRCEWFKGCD